MSDVNQEPSGGDEPESVEEYLGTAKRPRWRRWAKYWIPAAVIILLLLIISTCSRGGNQPNYITEPVERSSLDLTVTATGNLRPTNQVEVGSEVSGRIDEIYVDVNDEVERGQLLARINTDVVEDQIQQNRANLDAAHAAVAQAEATLEMDSAQLARLQEVQRLSDGRVPSQTELETAQANVARARAGLNSARANVVSAEAALSSSITNRDRAVIRSPVSGVVLARQVEPGQTVAASFNTPTLFVLAEDLSTMQLRVSIDEADVGQVGPGQNATFVVDAYPGRRFPAEVTRIDLASSNTAATTTSAQASGTQADSVISYEGRLAVDNSDGVLRPGMTATATIATESTGVELLVPNSALRFNPEDAAGEEGGNVLNPSIGLDQNQQQATIGVGSRQLVHVLQEDGTLQAVEVVTGQSDGRLTVVNSDELSEGMQVVTGVRARGQ